MEAYKNWVRRNKDYVHSLESLASGLTWLLPERFSESEIGPEAVSAFLGILTSINEHIIDTTPIRNQRGFLEPSPSPSPYPWSLCVSALKELETLVEVAAQQIYGDEKKWNFIAITEATKALFRLAILRDSGYKMLLHGGETLNSEKGTNDLGSQHERGGLARHGGSHGPANHYGHNMQNLEGRALSALSRFGENARMVPNSSQLGRRQYRHDAALDPPSSAVKRPTLSTVLSKTGFCGGLFLTAEVLHICRPLIYVLFIRKYGVRSWIPWLLSLGVDLTGSGLLFIVKHPYVCRKNGYSPLTPLEENEVRRRKLLWALYLMRDPVFSKYTRQRFEKTEKLLEPVPIIGFLTAKVVELVIGAQTRFTYMSGS